MTTKTNGSATPTATTDIIPYDDAVREGQQIILNIEAAERGQLRLGELADNLEPKYKDRTLAKFAAEIGVAKCTLDRYRTVYRAWRGKLAPGPNLVPYAALRELAKHPEREQIIARYPAITKRDALDLMRKHNGKAKEAKEEKQETEWLKHNRKWFKDLVELANDAARAANVVEQCTSEQLEDLLKAVDAHSLQFLRRDGRMLFNVANRLAELLGEDLEEARRPITRDRRAEAEEATAQVAIN